MKPLLLLVALSLFTVVPLQGEEEKHEYYFYWIPFTVLRLMYPAEDLWDWNWKRAPKDSIPPKMMEFINSDFKAWLRELNARPGHFKFHPEDFIFEAVILDPNKPIAYVLLYGKDEASEDRYAFAYHTISKLPAFFTMVPPQHRIGGYSREHHQTEPSPQEP